MRSGLPLPEATNSEYSAYHSGRTRKAVFFFFSKLDGPHIPPTEELLQHVYVIYRTKKTCLAPYLSASIGHGHAVTHDDARFSPDQRVKLGILEE